MPVTSTALGVWLPPREIVVTTRMTLEYAAAIGDDNPCTFDNAGDEPLIAPPPFCVVVEWPVLSAPARREVLGVSEAEARRSVHVEQDSTFHRVVRPGDRVVTTGRIAAIRQTRAGTLVATQLETRDATTGAAVVTTWHASIYRGVEVSGAGGAVIEAPARGGDTPSMAHRVDVALDRTMPHIYTACTGIWNPIHTERRAALAADLPDIILHGTMTWAFAAREIVRRAAGGDPTRLARLAARFGAPVTPVGTLAVRFAEPVDDRVAFRVDTLDGRPAVTDGFADLHPAPRC